MNSQSQSLNNHIKDIILQDNLDSLIELACEQLKQATNAQSCVFQIMDDGAKSQGDLYLDLFIRDVVIAQLVITEPQEINESELELYSLVISSVIEKIHTINELKINNEELLHHNQIKTELISTISHELRTPMTNILGFSELLTTKDFDQESQAYYQKEIYNSAQRLTNLITNFLDLARLEETGEISLQDFDSNEVDWLAQEAWQQLNGVNRHHEIEWDIEENLPQAPCDAEAITRVFVNLFGNAIKYSPPSGEGKEKISCQIKKEDDSIQVKIQDQGIGIEAKEIETIFDKFYRSENLESNGKKLFISGSGLGLWISKEIIDKHNGSIWAKSARNKGSKGSEFFFTLKLR